MARALKFTAGDLDCLLAKLAPHDLADEWDNVGQLLGDPRQAVRRVLVALDVTSAVLREARRRRAQALVTHHPLLFRSIKRLRTDDPTQRLALEAAAQGLSVIAAHTNLDRSPEGTNRALADRIGLRGAEILLPSRRNDTLKFTVFVPVGHERKIIAAIGRAGAGVIGRYSHCTFRSPGTGTYIPMKGAKPFAGKAGRLEQAEETRLECVVARHNLRRLVDEVRAAHPYEEMAYDVYPLEEVATAWGLGLVGELPKAMRLSGLVAWSKRRLRLSGVQVVGELGARVRRVAVSTGAGGDVARSLSPGRADVLVTGEIDHHDALAARERGLAVVCVGHFESEVIVVPYVARWLRKQERIQKAGVEMLESESERSPLRRA